VRIEASPINPSDLGRLFGPADMGTARASGTPNDPVVTASRMAWGIGGWLLTPLMRLRRR
jgi:hypothetical protein